MFAAAVLFSQVYNKGFAGRRPCLIQNIVLVVIYYNVNRDTYFQKRCILTSVDSGKPVNTHFCLEA